MARIKVDPLDRLFSEFIRLRAMVRVHGCERCHHGKTDYKQLQCSHYVGRSNHNVRWDEDNAAGLCPACHLYLGAHPAEHDAWFRKRLGQQGYDMLMARRRSSQGVDKSALTVYYKAKIEQLRKELF